MDAKLLLVQSISLLYWETKKPELNTNSKVVIEQLLGTIKLPENILDTDNGRSNLVNLKLTTEALLDSAEGMDYYALKQRLRLDISDDDALYTAAMEGISEEGDVMGRCLSYLTSIKRYFEELKFLETMKEMMSNSVYSQRAVNPKKLAREFIQNLERFVVNDNDEGTGRSNPLVVKGGGFDDVELLTQHISDSITQINQDGLMRTGYKAVNRMLHLGGLIRGDLYVVGARRGNNKTGLTLDITIDIPRYNKPFLFDPSKKPLILHITMENSYDQNLRYIAERAYYEKHGRLVSLLDTDPQVMAEMVKEYIGVNGFHFEAIWIPGGTATVFDIQQIILEYEAQGYEIHLLTIDYLALVDKAGLESTTAGSEIRDAFRRIRNFCNPKKITVLTPHQISSEATNLVRGGELNFVTKVAGMDYWDGCRRLTQEVDVEIIINVERIKRDNVNRAYMAMCIGKNRAVKNMPESHKSCAMEFNEWGLIPDVLKDDSEETFIKDISSIRQSFSTDGSEDNW